jgi:hypothetical protein
VTLGHFGDRSLDDVVLTNNITYMMPGYLKNGSAWVIVLPDFPPWFLNTTYGEYSGKFATAVVNEIVSVRKSS